jgi:hypothetical protein
MSSTVVYCMSRQPCNLVLLIFSQWPLAMLLLLLPIMLAYLKSSIRHAPVWSNRIMNL